MWKKISDKIKDAIGENDYNTYCSHVVQLGYNDNVLRLQAPDKIYANKVSDCIKQAGCSIGVVEWSYSPLSSVDEKEKFPDKKKVIDKTKINFRRKRTAFEGNPKFKSENELNNYINETKKNIQLLTNKTDCGDSQQACVANYKSQAYIMPNKYGLKGIANWTTLNSAMWTYPNDKRKSAVVSMYIDCADSSKSCFTLYRGQSFPDTEGIGQLTTTHFRLMSSLIKIWQDKGSKLLGNYLIVIECSVLDIIRLFGGKNNGRNYNRVKQYIADLFQSPFYMDDGKGHSLTYTILHSVNLSDNKKYSLGVHPFIARQLVNRKAIIRDTSTLKIKNPIALKLFLLLDNRLAVGHRIIMSLNDLVKELELNDTKTSSLVNNIKRAIAVLNNDVKVCGKTTDIRLSKNDYGEWQLIASLNPFAVVVENENKNLVGCKLLS